jgi:hypothetical protein
LLLVGLTGMHIDLDLVRRKAVGAAAISAGGLLIPLGLGFWAGLLLPAELVPGGTHRPVFEQSQSGSGSSRKPEAAA